jgi:O-antigen ligase
MAFATPLTVSRSAILGLVVGFTVLFSGWTARQRLTALAAAPGFLILTRILVPGLVGTIRSLFTNIASDPSYTGRTDDYEVVEAYVLQHPIFGRGFGTFVPGQDVTIDRPGSHITLDNQYLGQVIETGLLGLAALVALFAVGYACARGARRRSLDDERRDLALSLAASIASLAVMFVTFDGFAFPMVTGFTMVLIGCAGAMWRLVAQRHTTAPTAATARRTPR